MRSPFCIAERTRATARSIPSRRSGECVSRSYTGLRNLSTSSVEMIPRFERSVLTKSDMVVLYTTRMSDCIFCKIIRGELPSYKVYEDENTLAFLDIRPVNAGHTLVVPKKHSHNIFDIAPEDWATLAEAARVISIAIEQALKADGVNIAMNNREHAGQVVDHPHLHIIPRFKGDGLKLMPQRNYKENEAEESAGKIRAAL